MFLFEHFFELTLTGLALGSVYALVALGYTMVYGVLQLINFAHSEVFMYGTFAVVWTLYVLGAAFRDQHGRCRRHAGGGAGGRDGGIRRGGIAAGARGLPPADQAQRAQAGCPDFGNRRLLRAGRGHRPARPDHRAFGLADNIPRFVLRARDATGMPVEIVPQPVVRIVDYTITNIDLLVIVSALVMMVVLDQYIRRSRLGRGIRAVAQDPESAA